MIAIATKLENEKSANLRMPSGLQAPTTADCARSVRPFVVAWDPFG